MSPRFPLSLAIAAITVTSVASAQSNVIPGTDISLGRFGGLAQLGHENGAWPNGTAGFAMSTTSCNPGSVVVPWQAPMQPDHPFIAFMITRESDGRMVQISNQSWIKHTFLAVNASQCSPCQGGGGGLGIGCSDTYGIGINGSRNWLGPPEELDPWLGVWNPVCSYFDGPNCDGQSSFSTAGLNSIDHRVEVQDADLNVPGANFYYQGYYIVRAEPEANRTNNLGWRPFTPTWSGGSWNVAVGGTDIPTYDTVLHAWNGASVFSNTNGGDDGRLYVGSLAVPNGPVTRYEYAVHNRDNNRAVDAIHIPIAPGTNVTNFGFHDIDQNAGNDWTAQVVGSEVVFSTPNNPLMWNSIFNFWFDADSAPVTNNVVLDQHFGGPGAPDVTVTAVIPGGSAILPCQQADDSYEDNDVCAAAAAPGEGQQLGLYVSKTDDDWYQIDVDDGGTLTIDASFTHVNGDIDMELFASCGSSVVSDASASTTDDEQVSVTNTTGSTQTYFARIYVFQGSVSDCNNYNLSMSITGIVPPDPCASAMEDILEPNDICTTEAAPIVSGFYPALSVTGSLDDYYAIDVGPGQTVGVLTTFNHSMGDIDLRLTNGCNGASLDSSLSVSGTEFVGDTNNSGSTVTWIVRVYLFGSSQCNGYDMTVTVSGGTPANLTRYCFGDGSGTACPCNNDSTEGHLGGCMHSGGEGSKLFATGNPSVGGDTLEMEWTSGPPNTFGILTSADNRLPQMGNIGEGIQFADGLRCVGGNLIRHGSRMTNAFGDAANTWGPGTIVAQGGFVLGQTRHFAVLHRDDDTQVCMAGQNSSNAVTVTMTP